MNTLVLPSYWCPSTEEIRGRQAKKTNGKDIPRNVFSLLSTSSFSVSLALN